MGKTMTGEERLIQDFRRMMKGINENGYKTRAAYGNHVEQFLKFYWRKFHGQKLANVRGDHIRAYVKEMQEKGLSPSTIKSRLSAIRFAHEKAGGKRRLPDNKELGLEKRKVGKEDRAWTADEVRGGLTVAKNMGRMDAYNAIYIGYAFGLRIEEVCRIRKEDVEKALKYDGLTIKGKGGQVRTYPVQFEVQKKALQYFYDYARKNNLMPRDYVISPQGKGGVERQINSLENWMYANRDKFAMKNRKDDVRDGKKPRSKNITWHGLRHARAQIQYAKYKDEGRKDPKRMTSETLGHHRPDITNVYLAELPQRKKNK